MVKETMIHFVGQEISSMVDYAISKPVKIEKNIGDEYWRIVSDGEKNVASICITFIPDAKDNMHFHFSVRTSSLKYLFIILIEAIKRLGTNILTFGGADDYTFHIYWKSIKEEEVDANDLGIRPIYI